MPPPFYVALIHIVPQKKYAVEICQALKNSVNDNGGLVRKINNAGRRPLPTVMRAKMGLGKQKFANIVTVEFMANPKCALTAFDTVRKMDYCMRMSLLRADDLLLCRPPRPEAEPKGCIQDWTPEDETPPSPALLEYRSKVESEFSLLVKEKVQQGQSLYAHDLYIPQEEDLERVQEDGTLAEYEFDEEEYELLKKEHKEKVGGEEEKGKYDDDDDDDYSMFGIEPGEFDEPTKEAKSWKNKKKNK